MLWDDLPKEPPVDNGSANADPWAATEGNADAYDDAWDPERHATEWDATEDDDAWDPESDADEGDAPSGRATPPSGKAANGASRSEPWGDAPATAARAAQPADRRADNGRDRPVGTAVPPA